MTGKSLYHTGGCYFTVAARCLTDVYFLIRFPVLNFSVMLPLLGALTVAPWLSGPQVLGLIAVALAFHIFAYMLNDVLDLAIDRTEPLRQESPLVKGSISAQSALAVALLQIPLALGVTAWLRGDIMAYGALLIAFGLATVYNLWGKRCPWPLLMDAVVGSSCAVFALYGALITSRTAGTLTSVLMGLVFVLVLMINGIHGALRDLANDFRAGAHTTAIFLGARPAGDKALILPRRLACYALALQALLLFITLAPLAFNWLDYPWTARLFTAGVIFIPGAIPFRLLLLALRSSSDKWKVIFYGIIHLVLSLGLPVGLFAFRMETGLLTVMLTIYLLPILTMWWFYGLKWG